MMKFQAASKIFIGAGSLLCLLTSIIGFGAFNSIVSSTISSSLVLEEGGSAWEAWKEMPVPIYLRFYFFNITNPDQVAKGSKAILREMGPYVYREDWERLDVSTDSGNGTIRFRMTKTYFFDEDQSDGSETDRVTFINLIFVSTATMTSDFVGDPFMMKQIDQVLTSKGEKLTKTGTVRQILFDGIPLKAYLDVFRNPTVQEVGSELGIGLPEHMKDGKFAMLKNKNGTDDGWFVIKSGLDDITNLGQVVSYNGMESLKYWQDSSCNAINGSDGTTFPPFLTKEKRIDIFSPGICRSFSLKYHSESAVGPVETFRFVTDLNSWNAPKTNPNNWCFCPEGKTEKEACSNDGVFNIGPCSDGAALLLSQPHFYGAEQWIIDAVEGLEPEFEKHMTMVDFHPMTGVSVRSLGRMQFSIELLPIKDMPSFANVRHSVIPFAWIEESSTLGDQELRRLSSGGTVQAVLSVVRFIFIGIGAALIGWGFYTAKQNRRASPVKPFGPTSIATISEDISSSNKNSGSMIYENL